MRARWHGFFIFKAVLKGFGEYAFILANEKSPHKPGSACFFHSPTPWTIEPAAEKDNLLLGGSAPKPPEFAALCQEALDSKKKTVSKYRLGTVRSLEPLWQHMPLRLPSGRAVSCKSMKPVCLPFSRLKAPCCSESEYSGFVPSPCPVLFHLCPVLFRPRHAIFGGFSGSIFAGFRVAEGSEACHAE